MPAAPPIDPAVDRLAQALNRIATLYQFRALDRRLHGRLTVSQSYALRALFHQGPLAMGALARGLRTRRSTITGLVDQLAALGWVRRQPHPRDRRSWQVVLTAAGYRRYRAAHLAFLAHLAPLWRTRPSGERERLLRFLGELAETIHGWQQEPARPPRRPDSRHAHPA